MSTHGDETPATSAPATIATSVSHVGDTTVSNKARTEVELTDQTNLLPFRKIVACFMGLSLCIVVSTLDTVIIATAIPTISTAFNAGSIVSWVPSAYLLTSTAFQPLYGRFSDIFGRKAAIAVAMSIFMFGNLLAGFSRTIIQLIIFRGIAGAGGGGIISMAEIVISDIVSLRDRGKYQGIIGSVVAIGYAIGPVVGGALAQKVTWRWCFWICLPISLVSVLVVSFILPLKPVTGNVRQKLLAVDFTGALLTLIGCTLMILPLIWGGITFPWDSAVVLATLLSGAFVTALFCLWEWKGARLPIVPMYIFKESTVSGVYITMFINGFVFFSTLYYLPQYFQVVLGYGPIGASIFLIPVLVSQVIVSWLSGVMVSRTGKYTTIVHSGFALWSIACGLISTINARSHKAELVVFMLLSGSGSGQTLQTTTIATQASVSRRDMSVVTAFRNVRVALRLCIVPIILKLSLTHTKFIRLFGGTLALAISATIINNSLRASMHRLSLPASIISAVINDPSALAHPSSIGISTSIASDILNDGYTHGFRTVFILHAALNAVAFITSVFMIKQKELTRGDEQQLKEEARKMYEKKKKSNADPEKGSPDIPAQEVKNIPRDVDENSQKTATT